MTLTINADDAVVAAARARAESEHITLDEAVERLLVSYARRTLEVQRAMTTIHELQQVVDTSGRKYTRDEMNKRRLS